MAAAEMSDQVPDLQKKFERTFMFTISARVEGLATQRTIVYFPKVVNGVVVAVAPECFKDAIDNPTSVPISDWEMRCMFGVPRVHQIGDARTSKDGKTVSRQYHIKVNAISALDIFVVHKVHGKKERFTAQLKYNGKCYPMAHARAVVSQTGALSGSIKIDVFGAQAEHLSLPPKEIPSDMISEYLMQLGR